MRRARAVLSEFSAASGHEITTVHRSSAIGTIRREVRFRHDPYDVTVGAAWSRIEVWVQDFDTPLLFSLNRRGGLFALETEVPARIGRNRLRAYARDSAAAGPVAEWLLQERQQSLLDELDIVPREHLLICENGLIFAGTAERAWVDTLDILVCLADNLPRAHRIL